MASDAPQKKNPVGRLQNPTVAAPHWLSYTSVLQIVATRERPMEEAQQLALRVEAVADRFPLLKLLYLTHLKARDAVVRSAKALAEVDRQNLAEVQRLTRTYLDYTMGLHRLEGALTATLVCAEAPDLTEVIRLKTRLEHVRQEVINRTEADQLQFPASDVFGLPHLLSLITGRYHGEFTEDQPTDQGPDQDPGGVGGETGELVSPEPGGEGTGG